MVVKSENKTTGKKIDNWPSHLLNNEYMKRQSSPQTGILFTARTAQRMNWLEQGEGEQ